MALNILHPDGVQLGLPVTDHIGTGTNPRSGDAVLVGQLPGVALIDQQPDGLTTVKTNGVATLPVTGNDGTADAAVAVGDVVYFTAGEDALNTDDTGVRYGYALDPVAAGATDNIRVKIGY